MEPRRAGIDNGRMDPNNDPDDSREGAFGGEELTRDGGSFRFAPPREIPDHLHVDLHQEWEVQLWTREFGCSEEELKRAVKAVGNSARDVRGYLRGRQ